MISLTTILSVSFLMQGPSAVLPCATLLLPALWAAVGRGRIASAMAASAAVELMQGTARQCLDAASTVLMNMLGLVCDPVGGLVECPCQMRNASGVANALTAAEIVLSGVRQLIPFDEMLDAMSAGKNSCRIPRNRSRRLCSYFYGMFPLSVSRKYFAACRPVISPNDRF